MKSIKLSFLLVMMISGCTLQKPQVDSLVDICHCSSGDKIEVSYFDDDSLINLKYKGIEYVLKSHVSASGMRYDSANLTWWTKGGECSLFNKKNDTIIDNCNYRKTIKSIFK